eukprot:3930780-Amphidinium_carterae.1
MNVYPFQTDLRWQEAALSNMPHCAVKNLTLEEWGYIASGALTPMFVAAVCWHGSDWAVVRAGWD